MSEPQTNIEIEDVLSSIRRLISQDLRRPQPAAPRATENAQETAAGAPTLVLGPAQRIDATTDPAARDEDSSEAAPLPLEAAEGPTAGEAIAQSRAEGLLRGDALIGEGGAPQAEGAAPSEDQPFAEAEIAAHELQWDALAGDTFAAPEASQDPPGAPEGFDAFAIDDGVSISGKAVEIGPETTGATAATYREGSEALAAMEAAFAPSAPQPEARFEPELGDPFGGGEAEATLSERFEAADWIDAEQTDYVEPEACALEAFEVPEATLAEGAPGEAAPAAQGLEAGGEGLSGGPDTAAHDQREALSDADLEPEDVWTAAAGAMGFTPEDEAERAREATGEAAPAREGLRRLHLGDAAHFAPEPDPRPSTYDDIRAEIRSEMSDETVADNILADDRRTPGLEGLDEEVLRDMVRDMIRQELQGVLGERITRNVRKLVRREIQRALDAEQF